MIKIEQLSKHFHLPGGEVLKAVDGVDLQVKKGDVLGIVGPSGCGKTTLVRLLLRLIEPDTGRIYLDGKNILTMSQRQLRRYRPKYQIIWQHPQEALNPRMCIEESILEPIRYYQKISRAKEKKILMKHCVLVGLRPEVLKRFPHELSGGENQRAVMARVLTMGPELIIADEPTSALDISVQAQILHLLKKIQNEMGITLIFISHDLHIVRFLCRRVAHMSQGRIIKMGKTNELDIPHGSFLDCERELALKI